MLKIDVLSNYRNLSDEYESIYNYIKSLYNDSYVDELSSIRGYVGKEQKDLIRNLQIGCCEICDCSYLGDKRKDLGLVTDSDNFLLNNRYIIPVRNIDSSLIGLVGYFNDYKKYITTPSLFFSKEVLLFNTDYALQLSYDKFNGVVFLVEGMFDCLSLRAIGLPSIATMGSTVTSAKLEQLKLFKKVIYIPDNDSIGRSCLNRYSKKGWAVPYNATAIKLIGYVKIGEEDKKVKDVDNLVSWFDADSVKESLLQFSDCRDEIATLDLGDSRYE